MKQADGTRRYELLLTKIATFLKKRKEIELAVNSNSTDPRRKRVKTVSYEAVDVAFLMWFHECVSKLSNLLKCLKITTSKLAIKCLFDSEISQHRITFQRIHSECNSALVTDANLWCKREIKKVLGKYPDENIFKTDKIGLVFSVVARLYSCI